MKPLANFKLILLSTSSSFFSTIHLLPLQPPFRSPIAPIPTCNKGFSFHHVIELMNPFSHFSFSVADIIFYLLRDTKISTPKKVVKKKAPRKSTPKRSSAKSTPKKAPPATARHNNDDADKYFLWLCFMNNGGKTVSPVVLDICGVILSILPLLTIDSRFPTTTLSCRSLTSATRPRLGAFTS